MGGEQHADLTTSCFFLGTGFPCTALPKIPHCCQDGISIQRQAGLAQGQPALQVSEKYGCRPCC